LQLRVTFDVNAAASAAEVMPSASPTVRSKSRSISALWAPPAQGIFKGHDRDGWRRRSLEAPIPVKLTDTTKGRVISKQIQAEPNKTKQNSLDLFGFIPPNWDFSMGYGESK
jgi:hypothetical protein